MGIFVYGLVLDRFLSSLVLISKLLCLQPIPHTLISYLYTMDSPTAVLGGDSSIYMYLLYCLIQCSFVVTGAHSLSSFALEAIPVPLIGGLCYSDTCITMPYLWYEGLVLAAHRQGVWVWCY